MTAPRGGPTGGQNIRLLGVCQVSFEPCFQAQTEISADSWRSADTARFPSSPAAEGHAKRARDKRIRKCLDPAPFFPRTPERVDEFCKPIIEKDILELEFAYECG